MTATSNAAEALHMADELGTLEKNKLADMVFVDGNPAENIKVLEPRENIKMVWKEGKCFVDRREGRDIRVIPAEYGSWKIADA